MRNAIGILCIVSLIFISNNAQENPNYFKGNINDFYSSEASKVIIIPTNEIDKEVQDRIHEYIYKLKEKHWEKTQIIEDKKALEMDLSDYGLIVFGTIDGNLWLKKYREQFTFKLKDDKIILDREFKFINLALITTWYNPQNPENGVIIYTALRANNIININGIFHGPTDFVVGMGNAAIYAADYCKNNGKWTFKTCR